MVENNNKVAIIDTDSLLFAAAWGKKIWNPQIQDFERDDKGRLVYLEKTNEEIGDSINTMMHEILEDSNANSYIAFVKGKNSAAHRYGAKSDYKANRPKQVPSWWEYARQFIIDTWEAVSIDNLEVDDACNITRLVIPNSYMVAIDKDLLNLEGTHYNWRTQEWVTIDDVQAHVLFWSDMVTGQTGDGVAGLRGRGKAYFKKILDKHFGENLAPIILSEYIKEYGEEIGIQEYYKNYTCLKILDSYKDFIIPEPIPYNYEKEIEEDLFKQL